MGGLVQREHPQNGVEYRWGQMKLIKGAIFLAS